MKKTNVKLELRIDWSEIDAFGHVNNANYLNYYEHARWTMLAEEKIDLNSFKSWDRWPVIAGIDARAAGSLVLMRGVRMDDGTEQIDEMLRVPLTGIRMDSGANRASATLDGSGVETVIPKTRLLRGISYQAVDDGRRRVRCEVDTYLAPGDTADFGDGNSLTVGELVYTVNPISATMEVTEARP